MGLSTNGRPGDHPHIPPAWTCTSYYWCRKIECWSHLCRINISAFPSTSCLHLHFLSTESYDTEVWGLSKKEAKWRLCCQADQNLVQIFFSSDLFRFFFPFECCFNMSHRSKMDSLPFLDVTEWQIFECSHCLQAFWHRWSLTQDTNLYPAEFPPKK